MCPHLRRVKSLDALFFAPTVLHPLPRQCYRQRWGGGDGWSAAHDWNDTRRRGRMLVSGTPVKMWLLLYILDTKYII